MKKVFILLLLSCYCITPIAFGDTDQQADKTEQTEITSEATENKAAKKAAETWLKKHLAKNKKVLAALKKIKDPKTCKRAAKTIKQQGYKLKDRNDLETEVKRLNTPEMRVAIKKYSKTLTKLEEQIMEELERVETLVVEYEELNDTYDSMGINENVTTIALLSSRLILLSKYGEEEEEDAHFGPSK